MRKLKILGYNYTIEEQGDSDTIGAFGNSNSKTQCIHIATDLAPEQKQSTVLHEVIEAINYHLSLGLKHDTIMRLETALFQTLRENGVSLSKLGE